MEENINSQEQSVAAGPRKSPFLAGFLSAILPFGIGPFYNGETVKGLIYLIVFAGLVSLQSHGQSQPFAALILAGFYFFQIIDSVGAANRINRRSASGQGPAEAEVLPVEAVKSGSVFWGALLILVGAVLLLANFEVISYRAIFDLWPLVVIVIGGKLIFDYFAKSRD